MRTGQNRKNRAPLPEARSRGVMAAGRLLDGQEFRTLLTDRVGYVVGRDGRHATTTIRVILDPDTLKEQNIHPAVRVEGL